MKLRSIFTILIIILICTNISFSQKFVKVKKSAFLIEEVGFKEAWKQVRLGNRYFRADKKGSYQQALNHYLDAYNYNEDNAALNYLIGISYMKSAEPYKAYEYMENAFMIDGSLTEDLYYWAGLSKQYNHMFDDAIDDYEEYLITLPIKKLQKVKMKVDKRIFECKSGKKLMKKEVRCFIDNLGDGVNSKDPEYSPVFDFNDSILYFTSRRENTTGEKKSSTNNMYYEDIYFSRFAVGRWKAAVQMDKPINTKHNDAVVDLSPEGKELCIYKGNKGGGNLFNSQYAGQEWGKLGKMNKINMSKYRESSVSVTKDSMTLYFISDRKGGYGGQDIWVSHRTQDGKNWQNPQNLGSIVNTIYDEETVEISSDGRDLFFSSKGHNSMGGYDVFKSRKNDDGSWSQPVNLGYPINTPDDDMFFMLTSNEKFGYYASNRKEGFGDKDIYRVVFLGPEKPTHVSEGDPNDLIAYFAEPVNESDIEKPVNIKVIQLSVVKGIVSDAFSGEPIAASLELVDNITGKIVKTINTFPTTGAYSVPLPPGKDYALTAGAADYFFHSENFIIADTSTHEVIRKDIQLQPMGVGAKIVLNNVFFDTGKHKLRPESYAELTRLANILIRYKNVRVEISGHTDSRGSDINNQSLSQRRAQSVVDYMISIGVNLSQIVAVGYGESQPRADNVTAQGRQLNRRVEAKILEK